MIQNSMLVMNVIRVIIHFISIYLRIFNIMELDNVYKIVDKSILLMKCSDV